MEETELTPAEPSEPQRGSSLVDEQLAPTDGFTIVSNNPAPPLPQEEWEAIRNNDFRDRLELRKTVAFRLIGLLIWQNIGAFALVCWALYFKQLSDLQLIFGVLIGATLAETAVSIQYIVKYLFSDIPYPEK
jgi:hypothetical protein